MPAAESSRIKKAASVAPHCLRFTIPQTLGRGLPWQRFRCLELPGAEAIEWAGMKARRAGHAVSIGGLLRMTREQTAVWVISVFLLLATGQPVMAASPAWLIQLENEIDDDPRQAFNSAKAELAAATTESARELAQ